MLARGTPVSIQYHDSRITAYIWGEKEGYCSVVAPETNLIPLWLKKEEIHPLGNESYLSDSQIATFEHILSVGNNLLSFIHTLLLRRENHDRSKLQDPEREIFDRFTPLLKTLNYGSEEYKKALIDMKPALDHHYANNSHHPEFHKNGISGMSLIDLVEMLCDWVAATKRHADGDIYRSIEINQKRFGYSDDLKQILINTIPFIQE